MTKVQEPAYASIPMHDADGVATGEVWPQCVAIPGDKPSTRSDELSMESSGPTASDFLEHALLIGATIWKEAMRGPFRTEPTN